MFGNGVANARSSAFNGQRIPAAWHWAFRGGRSAARRIAACWRLDEVNSSEPDRTWIFAFRTAPRRGERRPIGENKWPNARVTLNCTRSGREVASAAGGAATS
jgi:hypothetical protein